MAKQELKWINMQASALTGDMLKAWQKLEAARKDFKASVITHARKDKALSDKETLVINVKPWGFGMAKSVTKAEQAQAKAGNMFANL